MGIYERDYKTPFKTSLQENALVMLISIQLVVFVLFLFIQVFYFFSYPKPIADARFYKDIYTQLALPAHFSEFGKKPWTLITHMFYHQGLWHLLGNILWLWMFGYLFQDLAGNKRIIPVFIYGALGGALAFMLAYNFFPGLKAISANMVGASGGIMAIAVGTTLLAPNYRIFPQLNGGIPLWIITAFYFLIDLALLPVSNTGGHIAHLAGGITGFLFIFFMRRGKDASVILNSFFDWVNNLFHPDKSPKNRKTERLYTSSRKPFTKITPLTSSRVDELLDKINQKGYSSLTEEEKEFLNKASREDLSS